MHWYSLVAPNNKSCIIGSCVSYFFLWALKSALQNMLLLAVGWIQLNKGVHFPHWIIKDNRHLVSTKHIPIHTLILHSFIQENMMVMIVSQTKDMLCRTWKRHVLPDMKKTCFARHEKDMFCQTWKRHVLPDMKKTCFARHEKDMFCQTWKRHVLPDMKKTCCARHEKDMFCQRWKRHVLPIHSPNTSFDRPVKYEKEEKRQKW